MNERRGIGRVTSMLAGRHFVASLAFLAGLMILGSFAHADLYTRKGGAGAQLPTIKSAEDALNNVPLVSRIPKSFLIGDGFKFKFSGMSLRIDHMGLNSKAPAHKRTCMLSASFSSPVAFFGSQMEIPIIFAETLRGRWAANTPGDYVVNLSKDAPSPSPTIGLSFNAKF